MIFPYKTWMDYSISDSISKVLKLLRERKIRRREEKSDWLVGGPQEPCDWATQGGGRQPGRVLSLPQGKTTGSLRQEPVEQHTTLPRSLRNTGAYYGFLNVVTTVENQCPKHKQNRRKIIFG